VYGQVELGSLREGDVVVLLTDGIWEAGAVNDDPFGRERAFDVVREYRDEPARDIVETLGAVVRQHCAPWAPTDDVTAVVVKIVPTEE
jgi:serine phosphatase RsbU (regulator of sigma subunit)